MKYTYFVFCNNCYGKSFFGGVVEVENMVRDEETFNELWKVTYDKSEADDYITIVNFILLNEEEL